jgi:hypothetical protein
MENQDLKQNILDRIKKDDVKMTSRQYFILKWFTLFVTSTFFLFVSFYLFAYIVFIFVDNGLVYIPLSTFDGLVSFIVEIPWTLVVLGILSVFLFSITSKTFYRIYRKPFLTFFFSILAIIVLSHLIFVETGTMKLLKEKAYEEKIQLVPEKFLQFRESQTGNLFVGYVVSTTSNSVIIRDRKNNLLEVILDIAVDYNAFSVGTHVNAYGQRVESKVYAKSIEIVE